MHTDIISCMGKPLLLKQDLQTSNLSFKICILDPINRIFRPLSYHNGPLTSTGYEWGVGNQNLLNWLWTIIFDCYKELKIITRFLLGLNEDPNLHLLNVLMAKYFALVLKGKLLWSWWMKKKKKKDPFEQYNRTERTEEQPAQEYSLKHCSLSISNSILCSINQALELTETYKVSFTKMWENSIVVKSDS